jgi:peptide deformylase
VAVRPVLTLPARVLKTVAPPGGGPPPQDLVAALIETMQASPACVGLAAPQIGTSSRVIVVDVSKHPKTTTSHGLVVVADPEIVDHSGRVVGREGCMSVPDLTANVGRYERVVVRGRDAAGDPLIISTEGFEARAFQHEIDHLDGLLILDRVSSLASDVFRRRTYR